MHISANKRSYTRNKGRLISSKFVTFWALAGRERCDKKGVRRGGSKRKMNKCAMGGGSKKYRLFE